MASHSTSVNFDPDFDPIVAMSPGLGMEGLQAFAVTRMSHDVRGEHGPSRSTLPKKPRLAWVFRWSLLVLRRPSLVTRGRALVR